MNIFGHAISMPQLYGQLLIGLINGSFYALLSLGLAVIFGMLTIVNFAHGAFYMMGAFAAYFLLQYAGFNYWWALILSPLAIGAIGALVERLFLKRLAGFDPLYGLLADLRPGAHHSGAVPELFRRLRPALRDPQAAQRRLQSRLHVPARLSRLGDPRLGGRMPGDLAHHREDQARRLFARRRPRTRPWCAPSASTCRAWSR